MKKINTKGDHATDASSTQLPPDRVIGRNLLDIIVDAITRHVILPTGAAEAIALWTVATHATDAFDIAPILAVTSPTKRCGKTNLVLILQAIVRNPQVASNISASALFRLIDQSHPTLLIDEADTQLPGNEMMRSIVNAGHTRKAAKIIRSVGKDADYEPRVFDVFGPKVLAGIGSLPSTIEDRAIQIRMRRRTRQEQVEPLRQDRIDQQIGWIGNEILDFITPYLDELRDADPPVPAGLTSDRARDNWRPLFAIADVVGGDWPRRARQAASLLSGDIEEEIGILILQDLRGFFTERDANRLSSAEIVNRLIQLEERPWATWNYGKPLTARDLSKLLKPFGISPREFRIRDKVLRGYERQDLDDAFDRYLPETATSVT